MGLETKSSVETNRARNITSDITSYECNKMRYIYSSYDHITYQVIAEQLEINRSTVGTHIREECNHKNGFNNDVLCRKLIVSLDIDSVIDSMYDSHKLSVQNIYTEGMDNFAQIIEDALYQYYNDVNEVLVINTGE